MMATVSHLIRDASSGRVIIQFNDPWQSWIEFSDFLNVWDTCWYQMKADFLLITHVEFYSWNMLHLEILGKNISNYSNHNYEYTVMYRQLQ